MNSPLVQQLTPSLSFQILAMILSLVAVSLVGTYLILGRRVPPILAGAAMLPIPVVAIAMALWADGAGVVADDPLANAHIALGNYTFAPFFMSLPAFVMVVLAAIAGVRRGPRSVPLIAVGAVLGLLLVAAPAAGGLVAGGGMLPLALLRSALYAPLVLAVPVAMAAGDPEHTGGPEAGAAAAITLAVFVGVCEASGVATAELLMLPAYAATYPDMRGQFLQHVDATTFAPVWPFLWGAVVVGAGIAIAAVAGCARDRRRALWAVPALALLAVPVASLALAGLSDAHWSDLGAALPDPRDAAAPAPGDPTTSETPPADAR